VAGIFATGSMCGGSEEPFEQAGITYIYADADVWTGRVEAGLRFFCGRWDQLADPVDARVCVEEISDHVEIQREHENVRPIFAGS